MFRLPLVFCLVLVPGIVAAQEVERFTTPAIVVGKITQIDHRKRTLTIKSATTKKAVELKAPFGSIYFVDGEKVDFDDFKVGQEKVAAYYSEKTFRLVSLRRHVDLKLPEERAQSRDGQNLTPEQQKIAKLESEIRGVTAAIDQRKQKKMPVKDLEKKNMGLRGRVGGAQEPEICQSSKAGRGTQGENHRGTRRDSQAEAGQDAPQRWPEG